MSLVERALEKARAANATGTPVTRPAAEPATPKRRREETGAAPASPAFPRTAANPAVKITDAQLEANGLRAPPGFVHQQTAEYRHVKRQLIASMNELTCEHRQVVLVTSALAGDGKTHSAGNLALSLAKEPDFSVLLIDADVAKPRLSRMFGLEDRPGLMDALAHHDKDPESLVLTTNVEGLSLLPAGHTLSNATELFASARMQEVMRNLSRPANRIIVVDSLPLLLSTESRALLPCAGQIVVVVRADVTPTLAVRQALELVGEGANVNLLLNACARDGFANPRYSGYHYNYTYGTESEAE
jgi:Mrp family chromosome partitioning ATPase